MLARKESYRGNIKPTADALSKHYFEEEKCGGRERERDRMSKKKESQSLAIARLQRYNCRSNPVDKLR
jgi:hypothetical protein